MKYKDKFLKAQHKVTAKGFRTVPSIVKEQFILYQKGQLIPHFLRKTKHLLMCYF